ncbi:hypothetical protein FJU30_10865 [Affinibrenneria salicis]|uniref:Uncharacterized protein n=1 Tax=Affinibrenneria salicis TaxID=2590031 RepID=A0A5J5G3U5_9GAMM|nr:hypothetical protein [Affinibrenneria salicis]KAA9000703.1 hypothetical protein FJU30_10865 [Affinibrenneria salicis]
MKNLTHWIDGVMALRPRRQTTPSPAAPGEKTINRISRRPTLRNDAIPIDSGSVYSIASRIDASLLTMPQRVTDDKRIKIIIKKQAIII